MIKNITTGEVKKKEANEISQKSIKLC